MTTAMVTLRPLDAVADLTLLHGWMQEPHVSPWWNLAGPPERTAAYLAGAAALAHQRSWVGAVGDEPFAYVETYTVSDDPLAAHYDAQPGDRGWHILVGPASQLGTGAARALARLVVDRLLDEPGATRVLCEPDARNARMLAFCAAVGGERIATLTLPDKTAALIAWTPGDLAQRARSPRPGAVG
ncbi:N(6)-hydroxylysine O-acetyltransferase [Paraconexibacter sp. AEG42_29]|uniref:Lysine N-acyltransferase MbtK n=1 Tax=Paraconexibacter sp. AEG42_29 TaxID=2997339 RepID=A0AAU7B2U4_9ACTN